MVIYLCSRSIVFKWQLDLPIITALYISILQISIINCKCIWCASRETRPRSSFFWYDNDRDLKVYFLVMHVIWFLVRFYPTRAERIWRLYAVRDFHYPCAQWSFSPHRISHNAPFPCWPMCATMQLMGNVEMYNLWPFHIIKMAFHKSYIWIWGIIIVSKNVVRVPWGKTAHTVKNATLYKIDISIWNKNYRSKWLELFGTKANCALQQQINSLWSK